MHLASLKRQKVKVAGETIEFRAGETIHTENSYKYSVESLGALARGVGWVPAGVWTDRANISRSRPSRWLGGRPPGASKPLRPLRRSPFAPGAGARQAMRSNLQGRNAHEDRRF